MYLLLTALALSAPPESYQQLANDTLSYVRTVELSMRDELQASGKRETQAWAKIQSKADWEKYRDVRIAALTKSLGQFPEVPKDLNVKVRKTIAGGDYAIDCVTFESRPGLLVTANLYRPAKPAAKGMPGISIVHSHHNPKTESELQDMGVMWAKAGCYVLVMDQLGHGERRQHPFVTQKDFAKEFRVGRQDYYFRYNLAIELQTAGDSLMGWMVWDIMRGNDLLLKQPGIDPDKLILLGAVAGGGDPCAVAAALDTRIKCAVPFNFGGPQPETTFPLPKDAEDRFLYTGSGSWESTRNLAYSAKDGFLPWVIVGAIAPRKHIYAHEFAWDKDRDPVWTRLQKIHGWYGSIDTLDETHGSGSVRGKAPESTHCNNIGAVHRKSIHVAFKKWFGIDAKEPEKRERRDREELWCLKPGEDAGKVHEIAGKLADERINAARARREKLQGEQRVEALRKEWIGLLGIEAKPKENKAWKADPVKCDIPNVEAVWLGHEGVLLLLPQQRKKTVAVKVFVAQGGPSMLLRQHHEELAKLLKSQAVALVDLGSWSNVMKGRGRNDVGVSSSRLMLGKPALGLYVETALRALAGIRRHDAIDTKAITLAGVSPSEANADGDHLRVPLDAAQPRLAEPMGAHVALLTALLDKDVHAVHVRGGLAGYRSLLGSPFVHVPYDVVVPGTLTVSDLDDVVAALAPRQVTIEGAVDGLNRKVAKADVKKAYALARKVYQEAKASDKLQFD